MHQVKLLKTKRRGEQVKLQNKKQFFFVYQVSSVSTSKWIQHLILHPNKPNECIETNQTNRKLINGIFIGSTFLCECCRSDAFPGTILTRKEEKKKTEFFFPLHIVLPQILQCLLPIALHPSGRVIKLSHLHFYVIFINLDLVLFASIN